MTVRRTDLHSNADQDGQLLAPSRQNVAITFSLAFIVTLQPAKPLQALSHSRNAQPLAGVSLKVTVVPWLKLAEQAPPLPQLIPVGELVTVPGPSSLTERVYVVVVPTLTAIDAEGMPFATTTSSLGPVSMLDGTSKLAVELLLSAIDKLLKLEVLA